MQIELDDRLWKGVRRFERRKLELKAEGLGLGDGDANDIECVGAAPRRCGRRCERAVADSVAARVDEGEQGDEERGEHRLGGYSRGF